jgi:hypothetical protein
VKFLTTKLFDKKKNCTQEKKTKIPVAYAKVE